MAQARTWVALDVHVSGVQAAVLDRESGELSSRRLPGRTAEVVEFVAGLPGPVRATYEAGPTGFVLARGLEAIGVDCLVWDEGTRVLRRLVARRAALVVNRVRSKNEIFAVLHRNLAARPPMTDAFGTAGRKWLDRLELPVDERDTINAALRRIDFLTEEIVTIEHRIAVFALYSEHARRRLTVPGVGLTTATTFLAHTGDIARFPTPNRLVGYLGLDPKVRQSGNETARTGRISKEGAALARHVLVEAALTAIRSPGPLRGFYERVRARRGHQIAIVASARKMTVLFWHLLTTEQDYAYSLPTPTAKKLRTIELKAGAARQKPEGPHTSINRERRRELERRSMEQAQTAYARTVADWHRIQRQKKAAQPQT